MHFAILFTTAVLSAGTLALPAVIEPALPLNTSVLEKRAHHMWIGPYADTDDTCRTLLPGPRPELKGDCVKFSSATDNVGINWGSFPLNFMTLDVFKDEDCKDFARTSIPAPQYVHDKGANTCLNQKINGGPWKSVKPSG